MAKRSVTFWRDNFSGQEILDADGDKVKNHCSLQGGLQESMTTDRGEKIGFWADPS